MKLFTVPPLLQDGMVQVSVFRNPNSSHWMTLKGLKSTHFAQTFGAQGNNRHLITRSLGRSILDIPCTVLYISSYWLLMIIVGACFLLMHQNFQLKSCMLWRLKLDSQMNHWFLLPDYCYLDILIMFDQTIGHVFWMVWVLMSSNETHLISKAISAFETLGKLIGCHWLG